MKLTVESLLTILVVYKIITKEEAQTALMTGYLPDDILNRLKKKEVTLKN
jgi:hypothetical protein